MMNNFIEQPLSKRKVKVAAECELTTQSQDVKSPQKPIKPADKTVFKE